MKNKVIDIIEKFGKTNDETKQIHYEYYHIDLVYQKNIEYCKQFFFGKYQIEWQQD